MSDAAIEAVLRRDRVIVAAVVVLTALAWASRVVARCGSLSVRPKSEMVRAPRPEPPRTIDYATLLCSIVFVLSPES
jgi:predicted metal-binding membrane protein